jgi:hypothetical protein
MVPQWWRKFTLTVIGKYEKRGNDVMILENAVYLPSAGAAKKRRVKYMSEERYYELPASSSIPNHVMTGVNPLIHPENAFKRHQNVRNHGCPHHEATILK